MQLVPLYELLIFLHHKALASQVAWPCTRVLRHGLGVGQQRSRLAASPPLSGAAHPGRPSSVAGTAGRQHDLKEGASAKAKAVWHALPVQTITCLLSLVFKDCAISDHLAP